MSKEATPPSAETKELPVEQIETRPGQPRTEFEPGALLELGQNLLAFGQLLPLIVFWAAEVGRFILIDGERRWRAAKLVGIKTLLAIVLEQEPSDALLHQLQMCIEAHRVGLSAIEKAKHLLRIRQENNWSISELAEKLNMKQPYVSKLLKFNDGCPELLAALQAGSIDQDKAYTICQESDHEKQRELMKQAGDLSREQLRQKARSKGQSVALKTAVARFALPRGVLVTVQGPKMDLSGAIDAMLETLRVLKKGQADSWDIVTAARVMRDRAKSAN